MVTRCEAFVNRAWLPVRRTRASCSDAPALSVSMIWTACIIDPASRPPKCLTLMFSSARTRCTAAMPAMLSAPSATPTAASTGSKASITAP